MYEHHTQPLIPLRHFLRRMLRHSLIASSLLAISLGIGVVGYHLTEGLPWIDALLNAAMLLGGMGPVNALHTTAGKLFASAYALFAGIVFLVMAGIIIAPLAHRLAHGLHLEAEDQEADGG